jgi:hypothetical protein
VGDSGIDAIISQVLSHQAYQDPFQSMVNVAKAFGSTGEDNWAWMACGVAIHFRKIKYPFVWYDILHVSEVLSRFSFLRTDPRYLNRITEIISQVEPKYQ